MTENRIEGRRAALRRPARRGKFNRVARLAARILGLSAVIVGGTIWTIEQHYPVYLDSRLPLTLPATVVQAGQPTEEAFRIGQFLGRFADDSAVAYRVADALVREGKKSNISPELLAGVVLTEDSSLNPRARSSVGAKGIMQVMPFHSGKWGCGSKDLFDIEANICHGVLILKQAMDGAPNIRVALLRYNGCVRGRNTPGCHSYGDKVLRRADRTAAALRMLRMAAAE